jgi:hypothetical protein
MDERWRIVARVREARARLAANEAAQHRGAEARAQAALDQARRLQAHYEEVAAQASAAAAAVHASDCSEVCFTAAEAQVLLSYAVGARLKAQEAAAPIRRAQLVCQRAQAAADEAGGKSRRAAQRREAVVSHWQENLRTARRHRIEREDEALVEERSGNTHGATDGGQ